MGYFIPKNPKVEHQLNTMVVHVRERGTPFLVPWMLVGHWVRSCPGIELPYFGEDTVPQN